MPLCPITFEEFLKSVILKDGEGNTLEMDVQYNVGTEQVAKPQGFKTNSFGWFNQTKFYVKLRLANKQTRVVRVQAVLNLTIIGSKDAG